MTPSSTHRIAVLGDGAWGTALATVLLDNGHDVTLWGPFPENLRAIAKTSCNQFLKGVKLPASLKVAEEIGGAVADADILALAAPSQYMRSTLEKLAPVFRKERHFVVNIAKGIETGSLKRMSELCREVLGDCRYAALSGPSHAEEVARHVPTAVVIASESVDDARLLRDVFMNERFRVYTSRDVTGVELGGALKNVYAIASGIIAGMELGDNPNAAMMTRAIAELSRLGTALGGKALTFSGLSGIGDLIVTCLSRHSRNRFVGESLGKGRTMAEIAADLGMAVAEGVETAASAHELAARLRVETPLIDTVYDILYRGKSPAVAVAELMTRAAKEETA